MTSPDVLALLAETTVASSFAILLVLLVRNPLRRAFGAAAGYSVWIVVPVALAAVLLPTGTGALDALVPAWVAVPSGMQVHAADVAGSGPDAQGWLVAAWSTGVVVAVLRLARQQRGFTSRLGALRSLGDGTFQAVAVAGLPAVVGLFRPVTVLPADFESRYDPRQQVLLRAHEKFHVARGDVRVNAVVAAFRCVFWFNPIAHFAAHAFRLDQEMACDERVIAAYPTLRRAYGEAMLQTQLASQPLPLGCHWGFQHPLKERIDMLRQHKSSPLRWLAGSSLVLALAMTSGLAAWAGQAPAEGAAAPVLGEQTPPPAYPAGLAAQDVGGRVVLLIDIDASGRPTKVTVESSEPEGVFDQMSIDAARKWSFKPAIENGKAVPSQVRVPIDFAPDGPPAEIATVNQHPAG